MVNKIRQYDIYWISLDPIIGSEMAKIRPCVVVSPNEMNQFLRTVVIIPITSTLKDYPWRINCTISGRNGSVATDQIKAIDTSRIGKKVGMLLTKEIELLKEVIQKMLID
ncbi:MAG: type II toxin-antitoxin system PemK/MazF family toxin [Sphingobacteriaceae bacterium]|nr:MAG: type II toxin-antitoxin system PemK/MazF family toxin [Sphingobacteriaceae bacterium]